MNFKIILFFTTVAITTTFGSESSRPNIVFVLIDDVGWADINYNIGGMSTIPTPDIDKLAGEGLKLKQHYVHQTCTPSRAALMTGRYASNTGLPFAMFPGSVAGLPEDMATMPQLLREAGYSAHMVGKWHLGHAQWRQGPVGRGFESHTGSFMWDLESYSKLMWRNPFQVFGADWGKFYENGSYVHAAEPRHATIAITEEAIERMKDHQSDNPLFLYVSYNAAHSPLQPEPEWEDKCIHIPHLWRRQYCGMMVGLDIAIGRLVVEANKYLGENTVVVVSSDNGGSTWFGGLNAPLRSGKSDPFEGGVKVPAFVLDLSGQYVLTGGEEHNHIFHISDWLPTFLAWAGSTDLVTGLGLDGLDQSAGMKTNDKVRDDVLLDLYTAKESHDGSESAAYRKGNYKIIQGNIRDPHWYSEPTDDRVSTSDQSLLPRILEGFIRIIEYIFGNGSTDIMPHAFVVNVVLYKKYAEEAGIKTMVFDLENDPEERNDISRSNPEVTRDLLEMVNKYKANRPFHHRYWMVTPDWRTGFVSGECSHQQVLSESQCSFAHPWVPDSSDIRDETALGLVNGMERFNSQLNMILLCFVLVFILLLFLLFIIFWRIKIVIQGTKEKQN